MKAARSASLTSEASLSIHKDFCRDCKLHVSKVPSKKKTRNIGGCRSAENTGEGTGSYVKQVSKSHVDRVASERGNKELKKFNEILGTSAPRDWKYLQSEQ